MSSIFQLPSRLSTTGSPTGSANQSTISLNAAFGEEDEESTLATKNVCALSDDEDDQTSRSKRSYGVCGTPTDEHKPTSRLKNSRLKR